MVDVAAKEVTEREAVAEAWLVMAPATVSALQARTLKKGDAIAAARLAGIQAAKRTDELIPLCHTLPLSLAEVEVEFPALTGEAGGGEERAEALPEGAPREARVRVVARTRATAQTGVEMEALVAAAVAALTLYDFCKSLERGVRVEGIALLEKSGGTSGHWKARA